MSSPRALKPLVLAVSVISSSILFADSTLPEIVVTATRTPQIHAGLVADTTVITADDIQNSTASTVQEVLATLGGVNTRSLDGSSDTALDIRGFGITGSSNTLVLINGVKQNDDDLSVPRLAQIPLAAIERIEIVRGSGTVAYGGGATGGVINVITYAKITGETHASLSGLVGDYGTAASRAGLQTGGKNWVWATSLSQAQTDNTRDNDRSEQKSFLSDWSGQWDGTHLTLSANFDRQHLGFPGPLTAAQWQADPNQASTPKDFGDRESQQFAVNVSQKSGDWQFYLDAAQRDKKTDSQFFAFGGYADHRQLSTQSLAPRLAWTTAWGGWVQQTTLGLDVEQSAQALQNTYGSDQVDQTLSAAYIDYRVTVPSGMQFSLGTRQQRVQDQRESLGQSQYQTVNAGQFGVSLPVTTNAQVYGKYGRSFRVANADEQAYTEGGVLRPQTSLDSELGWIWSDAGSRVRLSAYQIDLTDEIHYLPFAGLFGANVNLPPTQRAGLELESTWKWSDAWSATINATVQQAHYQNGHIGGVDLTDKEVPLVPKKSADWVINWHVNAQYGLAWTAHYIGEQRLDNDQANVSNNRLPPSVVNDIAFTRRDTAWSARLSLRNVFDKSYASYGYVVGTSYGVYPAPRRTVQLDLTATW